MRAAGPVVRRRQEWAGRIGLDEVEEGVQRVLVLAGLEEVQRGFIVTGFRSRVGRGIRRLGFCADLRLQLAQPVVEVDVEVLLPFLRGFDFVRQHFDLPAQFGHFRLECLDLVGQFDLTP